MKNDPSSPSRKRRKEARPAEILAAALQVFREHGFAGARLDDVAARAGIAKGTIYRYFESKDALFEAVVRNEILPLLASIDQAIGQFTGETSELLGALLRQAYEHMVNSDRRYILRMIIAEGERFPQLAVFYHNTIIKPAEQLIARIIRRGCERGEFSTESLEQHPQIVIGPVITAVIWKLTFERVSAVDLDSYCRTHIETLLLGLKRR